MKLLKLVGIWSIAVALLPVGIVAGVVFAIGKGAWAQLRFWKEGALYLFEDVLCELGKSFVGLLRMSLMI
jgi:hypothetical protein